MTNSKVYFIINNVKDLQSSKKRLKLIEYLKHKLESNRVLFLQETHSVSDNKNAWNDDFKGQAFFSHGTSNSWGVVITYLGSRCFVVKSKSNNHAGRISIPEFIIDDTDSF